MKLGCLRGKITCDEFMDVWLQFDRVLALPANTSHLFAFLKKNFPQVTVETDRQATGGALEHAVMPGFSGIRGFIWRKLRCLMLVS